MSSYQKSICTFKRYGVFIGTLCFGVGAAGNDPKMSLQTFGVVNIEKVLEPATESLKGQVEKLLESYYKEFAAYEENLRIESQALVESQKKIQAQDEPARRTWEAQRRNFEKRVLDIQKKAEARRKALGEAHGQVMQNLQNLLAEVIQEVGNRKNIDLILPQNQVVYWKPSLDLTAEVSQKLKERMPVVILEVKEPSNA